MKKIIELVSNGDKIYLNYWNMDTVTSVEVINNQLILLKIDGEKEIITLNEFINLIIEQKP